MTITSDIFEAYLKYPAKCWFRFQGEEIAGNMYSHWVGKQNHLYREAALKQILDDIGGGDFTSSPAPPLNMKMAKWRLAADPCGPDKPLLTLSRHCPSLSNFMGQTLMWHDSSA
jgi:hypothetical protein